MRRNGLELLSKAELIELLVRRDRQIAELTSRCEALEKRNAELADRCVRLERRNAELEARCGKLESDLARARKDSSNSSKPPSSDIVKPPRAGDKKSNGKIGGQPGHVRQERAPFPPEQVDKIVEHRHRRCPKCGGAVQPLKVPPRVLQQVELVEKQ